MKSLQEWKDEQEQIDEAMGQRPGNPQQGDMVGLPTSGKSPMDVVQTVMARIAPMVAHAHQQIEGWPNEREKSAARRTLDAQLLKASRDQWMGKAKQATNRMGQGMNAARAMKQFGGINTAAANQLGQ